MLYTKKFVFTVSLCAMLAANPVLAVTNPVTAAAGAKSGTPGVVSTVYSDWAGRADSGIAGVTYVNNAVDAAGNAAQWAENHAAAAAQSAKSAAGSASDAAKVLEKAVLRPDDVVKEGKAVGSESLPVYVKADGTVKTITSYEGKAATAGTADKAKADINGDQIDTTYEKVGNKVTTLSDTPTDTQYPSAKLVHDKLAEKVDKDQGADKKNLAMVTNDDGTVYPGYITNDMIAEKSVSATNKLHAGNYNEFKVLKAGTSGLGVNPKYITTEWGFITKDNIDDGAVTTSKIADDAVTRYKIADGAVTSDKMNSNGAAPGQALVPGPGTGTSVIWGQVGSDGIANGAVTAEKIAAGSDMVGDVLLTKSGASGFYAEWGRVISESIAKGAVTIEKTAGVVGMVPVGSADATTYSQMWIE